MMAGMTPPTLVVYASIPPGNPVDRRPGRSGRLTAVALLDPPTEPARWSLAELNARLDTVRSAPPDAGTVELIVRRPARRRAGGARRGTARPGRGPRRRHLEPPPEQEDPRRQPAPRDAAERDERTSRAAWSPPTIAVAAGAVRRPALPRPRHQRGQPPPGHEAGPRRRGRHRGHGRAAPRLRQVLRALRRRRGPLRQLGGGPPAPAPRPEREGRRPGAIRPGDPVRKVPDAAVGSVRACPSPPASTTSPPSRPTWT